MNYSNPQPTTFTSATTTTTTKDILGDRMKSYETIEAMRKLNSSLPIIIRLDGRAFHSFTKGLDRPFDSLFISAMKETAKYVMLTCNANLAYTQSDEITLVILTKGDAFFSSRTQKLCSIAASAATVKFNNEIRNVLSEIYVNKMPTFDARVWNVPSLEEAANTVLWRELDAEKNSVAMAAQAVFSHELLLGKNKEQMKQMLQQIGKSWENLSIECQRGVYFKKIATRKKFSREELELLPLKHHARVNPDFEFERSEITQMKLPRLVEVEDKVKLLFG
jgi:tRNA(His) guanylyltransferase